VASSPGEVLDNEGVESVAIHACPFCSQAGRPVFQGLRDELFGAPGTWSLARCTNRSCGLVWLTPAPLPAALAKVYGSYYTHASETPSSSVARRAYIVVRDAYVRRRYGPASGAGSAAGLLLYLHPGRRADADYRAMYLRVRPGGALLDVGCGAGQVLEGLNELGWAGRGLDPDPEAVAEAGRRGLSVETGTLHDQRYDDGTFDAVVSSHVIEHVFDPRALLHEMHRVLKPGGACVVVTPNFDSWGRRRYGRHWRGLEPPRHLSIFHSALLAQMARDAGFAAVDVASTIRGAHEYFTASMGVKRSAPLTTSARLWARVLQMAEWAIVKRAPDRGEELVLVARKGG
jgi:2-polyprenyl-3-methyl-5-hydroxy-6-metoxy-1,4-benzoquinol methylase